MRATILSNFHARAPVKISMFQVQNLQYDFCRQYPGVIVAAIMIAFLYLHASDVHQHSFNRSQVETALLRHWLRK